jgi:hypothetical protein
MSYGNPGGRSKIAFDLTSAGLKGRQARRTFVWGKITTKVLKKSRNISFCVVAFCPSAAKAAISGLLAARLKPWAGSR